MDKVDFYKNLVDASSIEQRFIFLDDAGYLPAPKRLSPAQAFGTLFAVGALLGAGGVARVPQVARGNDDVSALAAELRKYKPVADVVGVSLRTGRITLRLGIDANDLPLDYIIRLFSAIHQHSISLTKYADSFGYTLSIAQGLILFSQHSRAKHFSDHIAVKCMHGSGSGPVITQPWVVDLEDESVTTCARFWQSRRHLPLDAKGMLPRLFQKRETKNLKVLATASL
jgi:hypothetical protein